MGCALSGNDITDYCRDVETYLCRKNDGHLIRVVGPSFDLVCAWAADGVPLKVAFAGIDRCFERYYSKGPRRRPVKIDFCEADVLDAFDEWRRAVGLPAAAPDQTGEAVSEGRSTTSLPAHLERVVARLTSARASDRIDERIDGVIDAIARELDVARASARGVRGEARQALLTRLAGLDQELLRAVRSVLDEGASQVLQDEAELELAGFRERMAPDGFARAREAAFDRLVRERFGLPTVRFD